MRIADWPDSLVLLWLQNEKGYSQNGAARALKNFRATMKFTGLDDTPDWQRERRFEEAIRKVQEAQP